MPDRFDVFISYSSRDAEIVSRVVDDLVAAGLTVWWDQSAIMPAARIREAINDGIKKSSTVLIFISPRSLQSRWVLNELDAAMLREIRERRSLVIPVLIGRVDEDSLPDDLKGKKYIDLRHNFTKKYALQRVYLHTVLLSSIQAVGEVVGEQYPVGDALANFFANRHLTRRDRTSSSMHAAAEEWADFLTPLLSDLDGSWGSEEEGKQAREEYESRYGQVGIRQLITFFAEVHRINGRRFTEEQFIGVARDVIFTFLLFKAPAFMDSDERIVAILGADGQMRFKYDRD